jgi:hypothetical protein
VNRAVVPMRMGATGAQTLGVLKTLLETKLNSIF